MHCSDDLVPEVDAHLTEEGLQGGRVLQDTFPAPADMGKTMASGEMLQEDG